MKRTVLAVNQALISWVRTSLSLISFGFTIYKFLESVQKQATTQVRNPEGPRNIGLFLIAVGTVPLLMAIVQFWVAMRRDLGVRRRKLLLNPGLLVASALGLLGLFLLFTIVSRLEVF